MKAYTFAAVPLSTAQVTEIAATDSNHGLYELPIFSAGGASTSGALALVEGVASKTLHVLSSPLNRCWTSQLAWFNLWLDAIERQKSSGDGGAPKYRSRHRFVVCP